MRGVVCVDGRNVNDIMKEDQIKQLTVCALLIVLITGCGKTALTEAEYTIRIAGTDGLKFSGSYMQVGSSGSSESQSIEGTVPAEYTIKGAIASVVFQKKERNGTLRVEIVRDGKVVKSAETSAEYGVVSIATAE